MPCLGWSYEPYYFEKGKGLLQLVCLKKQAHIRESHCTLAPFY